jgi:hypothetical protein
MSSTFAARAFAHGSRPTSNVSNNTIDLETLETRISRKTSQTLDRPTC